MSEEIKEIPNGQIINHEVFIMLADNPRMVIRAKDVK